MNTRRWHIIISGYAQNYGTPTGCERVWAGVDDVAAGQEGVRCLYFPWNSPWSEIADGIKRNSVQGAEVFIYAYSWGCGYGFVQLANELDARGMVVSVAVLCDPVWRDPRIPGWAGPVGSGLRSILLSKTIRVPRNVITVHWCYQRNNKPDGDEPVPTAWHTRIYPVNDNPAKGDPKTGYKLVDAVHATADESSWFLETSLRVAREGW